MPGLAKSTKYSECVHQVHRPEIHFKLLVCVSVKNVSPSPSLPRAALNISGTKVLLTRA